MFSLNNVSKNQQIRADNFEYIRSKGVERDINKVEVIMFLKHVPTDDLVEVVNLSDVTNPHSATIRVRSYENDVIQRPRNCLKNDLSFPSGEPLPACWTLVSRRNRHAA